jgi:hypothetical protein
MSSAVVVVGVSQQRQHAPFSKSVQPSKRTHVKNPMSASPWVLIAATIAISAGVTTDMLQTEQSTTSTHRPSLRLRVSDKDVDALVQQVLADPTMNMTNIPDILEAAIYKQTILTVLDYLYAAVSQLDGMEILVGHVLQLAVRRETDQEATVRGRLVRDQSGIDEHILEQVADRLLRNQVVNSPVIPDAVERQIYSHCLKLTARLLDTVANTFSMTVCGHSLGMYLEPAAATMDRVTAAPSSASRIDVKRLAATMAAADHGSDMFTHHVMQSVNAVVLGILDDVLANCEIQLLSDRVSLNVMPTTAVAAVAVAAADSRTAAGGSSSNNNKETSHATDHSSSIKKSWVPRTLIFATGVAVGAVLTTFLGDRCGGRFTR